MEAAEQIERAQLLWERGQRRRAQIRCFEPSCHFAMLGSASSFMAVSGCRRHYLPSSTRKELGTESGGVYTFKEVARQHAMFVYMQDDQRTIRPPTHPKPQCFIMQLHQDIKVLWVCHALISNKPD